MTDWELLQHEASIRLIAFSAVFAFMALWEFLAARRERSMPRTRRWPSNIGVVIVDSFLVRIVAPAGAVGFAVLAQTQNWGLLSVINLPAWFEFLFSLLLLDLAIYFQHRIFHHVPILWRLHRMHHADLDIDVTTGVRFHPLEILLSLAIKFIAIVALGAPPVAVLVFEIALNATSMFNHSNAGMPVWLDRVLRWILVTPDMHRVHHSILRHETDSNFGFNFPWWDRLFRTYRPQPETGHDKMTIGLEQFRDPRELRFDRLLTQPFRNDSGKSNSHGTKAGR